MLYIFQVDTGTMLTFDMTLAMETVSRLQQAISKVYRIPTDKQVLLISGGENLDPKAIVGSYHAGTDTNPIYLFSKHSIESATAPSASVNYGSPIDVQDQVEASLNMSVSYETVVARTQLAMDIQDVATSELSACERIVHDQHLQHQGWAAVIANLEDITSAFNSRTKMFETNYNEYLASRDYYMNVLADFSTTLSLLGKIPLLDCLDADGVRIPSTRSGSSSADSTTSKRTISPMSETAQDGLNKPKTLLEWISAQDSRHTLTEMAQKCSLSLGQFDTSVLGNLLQQVGEVGSHLDNVDMKQVKGLEDRLFSLEQIIHKAKLTVQEQKDIAQGFLQNQTRAQNLQDPSVLPDLCTSHKRQLLVMIKNHQTLKIVKKQCAATKEELAQNLHTRLRWVMFVEKKICDVDSSLVIHHETLKKLKRKLEIIMQMHNAPALYAQAVVEVVRRKAATSTFLKWAESLAEERSDAHCKEVENREKFLENMKHHFLHALFPGIDDFPPPFAITAPKTYDDQLPAIQPEDVMFLRDQVPELADKLRLPDPVEPTSNETITAEDTEGLQVPKLTGDTTTHSYDPACSDIVILESEEQEDKKEEEAEEEEEESADIEFFSLKQPVDSHPLSVSEPVPMPRMALGTTPQDAVLAAPSPPYNLPPTVAVTKENLSKSSGAPVASSFKLSAPGVNVSSKTVTSDKGCQMEPLNLSEELESPEGPPTKMEKREIIMGKSPSGISPSLDEYASEGFTTADFYIDESMPSSMTESNTRKVNELQQVIQEKSNLLEVRERELEEQRRTVDELKPKLQKAKENFKLLQDIAEKGTLQLKCELLSLEKQTTKEKDEFQQYMASVTGKLLEKISSFEQSQTDKWEKTVAEMKEEYKIEQGKWEEKLELEVQKLHDTQSQLELYEAKLRDKDEEIDQACNDLKKKLREQEAKAEEEISQAKSQLCLEHELELEKVQSELSSQLEVKGSELSRLEDEMNENIETIVRLEKELHIVGDKLKADFESEKQMVINEMKSESEKLCKEAEDKCREMLMKEHKLKICELNNEQEERIKIECDKVSETLQKLHAEEIAKIRNILNEEFEAKMDDVKKQLIEENQVQVDKLNSTNSELQSQVTELQELQQNLAKERDECLQSYQIEREQIQKQHEESVKDTIALERHNEVIAEMKTAFNAEKEDAVAQAMTRLQEAHNEEMESVMRRSQQEKHDSISLMQSSITAEKQILFNEALNKAVSDKEKTIDELRKNEESLKQENIKQKERLVELEEQLGKQQQQQQQQQQQTAAGVDEESERALNMDREKESRVIQQRLEEELSSAQKQILHLQSELQQHQSRLTGPAASMMASVAPISDLPQDHPRIQELEQLVKSKEEELTTMLEKMNELSMTTSTRGLVQDKVSITTCNKGDIVLLCLDERHDHYVVFTVGTTLHFLHSDCLETLGLKTAPGQTKKSWVLAEIMDKEYCQAKKPNNRFKVPVGTKFYRVKARPWEKERGAAASMLASTTASR